MLELNHEIRQHTMQTSASGIVAFGTGDPKPFRLTALIPDDSVAMVTVAEVAFLTGWANIISALN